MSNQWDTIIWWVTNKNLKSNFNNDSLYENCVLNYSRMIEPYSTGLNSYPYKICNAKYLIHCLPKKPKPPPPNVNGPTSVRSGTLVNPAQRTATPLLIKQRAKPKQTHTLTFSTTGSTKQHVNFCIVSSDKKM